MERYGPWAVIAGASVGLGAEFARQLAARGLKLVLIARNAEALAALAAELPVETRILAADLGAAEIGELVSSITSGLEVGLLVYNAAHSRIGPFLDQPLAEHLQTIAVNCRGPLLLAHQLGGPMRARGRGGIILMTSLAGMQGTPMLSPYAASKAFNLVLAEGLWDELRHAGVDVLACRAGATRTPGFDASKPVGSTAMMEPADVVRAALAALGTRPSLVTGWRNRLAVFFLSRVLPRRLAVRVMGRAMVKLYGPR